MGDEIEINHKFSLILLSHFISHTFFSVVIWDLFLIVIMVDGGLRKL